MADNSTIPNGAGGGGGGGIWYLQYFELLVGLGAAFGLLLFLLLYCLTVAICTCVFCRKCGRRRPRRSEVDVPRSESALGLMEKQMKNPVDPILLEMGVVAGLLQGENSVHNPAFVTGVAKEQQMEFPRTNICILRELGETTFGPVYLGEGTGLDENELSTTVLIKTLKLGSTAAVQEEFNNELNWAVDFKHPNILPLLAVCTHDQPKYLIYEYLEYGTLKHFLQSTASALGAFNDALTDYDSTSTLQCHPILELEVLIKFAKQIASAMQYLGEQGFVHQDLAARNIHVGKSMAAKIANFGFSRDVRSSDYYHMKDLRDKLLPVRWLAPETLKEGIYSPETDMWAYGVVLWEIFNCGQTPYKALSNPEVIQRILKAKPLGKPAHCPDDIYRIMLACWQKEPQLRPTAKEVSRQLEKLETTSLQPRSRGWSWRKGSKLQQHRQSSQSSSLPRMPERARQNSDAVL